MSTEPATAPTPTLRLLKGWAVSCPAWYALCLWLAAIIAAVQTTESFRSTGVPAAIGRGSRCITATRCRGEPARSAQSLFCSSPRRNRCDSRLHALNEPKSSRHQVTDNIKALATRWILPTVTVSSFVVGEYLSGTNSKVLADEGLISLNTTLPEVTDTCWIDISIDGDAPQRIDIALFGKVVPQTVENFKQLCLNEGGQGYRGSDIFRIISPFSIQGGNVGAPVDAPASRLGRYGRAANNGPAFPAENFRILHDYKTAGVVSMMKDQTNGGLQDSRFFITLSPAAGWADDKYVAFGVVTAGMGVVNKLAQVSVVPPSNHPQSPIKIVDSGCY